MASKKTVSIIIPEYNEELNIKRAYEEVNKVFGKIPKYKLEIVFVDNCSKDSSPEIIKKIAKKDKQVVAVILSRNFGGEYSSLAGMRVATGDAICVLDCDLQDPPELLPKFIEEWEKGYEVIVGVRVENNRNWLMKLIKKAFYKLLKVISNIEIPTNAGTYSLVDKKVQVIINELPEKNRFYRGLRAWVGFRVAKVNYRRRSRLLGSSKNNLIDYIRDAERGIFGFSFVPLELVTYLGFLMVIISFTFISTYIILFLFLGNPIPGFMTIISLVTFIGGIQTLAISIVGKYVQIIFEETKNRPPYIIREIINDHRKKIQKISSHNVVNSS